MTENGSLYRTHAQCDAKKGDFNLTIQNIDDYLSYSLQMFNDIKWLNSYMNLKYKLNNPDKIDDELYTEEYLKRRLEKVKNEREIDENVTKILEIRNDLHNVNIEIDQVRPLVFDKIEGEKIEHHERMSYLDDQRRKLEEDINEYYGEKYPKLQKDLPKIYYMIIDGVDISTVVSCFRKMKMVLMNEITAEKAAEKLMDESTEKYNLPTKIWDPIKRR